MAATIARGLSRCVASSTSTTARAFLRRKSGGKSKINGVGGTGFSPPPPSSRTTSSPFTSQNSRSHSSFRLGRALGCVENMMPLHSVTASALLNSMLSVEAKNWGWLSEGLAYTSITRPEQFVAEADQEHHS